MRCGTEPRQPSRVWAQICVLGLCAETRKYGILEVDHNLRALCMKEKPLPTETASRRAVSPPPTEAAEALVWCSSRLYGSDRQVGSDPTSHNIKTHSLIQTQQLGHD